MSAAPTSADSAAPEPLGDEVRWELDTLKELGDLGMRLARASVAEAEARAAASKAEPAAKAADPALAFHRISRAVRLTVTLHARIREGRLGKAAEAVAAAGPSLDAPKPVDPEPLDPKAQAELEDRRVTGRLRRSMTHYIAETAVKALEREAPETERLFEALEARLDREGSDDADFAELDVKSLALTICRDLGVDPGPDWWEEGWGIIAPPPCVTRGGGVVSADPPGGPDAIANALTIAAKNAAGKPAARESLLASGATSALQPQIFRSG